MTGFLLVVGMVTLVSAAAVIATDLRKRGLVSESIRPPIDFREPIQETSDSRATMTTLSGIRETIGN